ncbi:unnamed protein product [Darwinula stevensoni]|uniref:Kringle domain-containing protein n=1 Tax=Darwinula stevensoni TaxID=69355 RepID=A0A7R8X9M2_9CRUS|nr:unnamed protein product [Darwinula stevensoni]CAG0885724.1 unnamed protein product [Darwinula stevensoni]
MNVAMMEWTYLSVLFIHLIPGVIPMDRTLVYRKEFPEKRYKTVAMEYHGQTLGRCALKCVYADPQAECEVFNFRQSDQSCQLIVPGNYEMVPAEGYLAYTRLSCASAHPMMKNVNVTYEGWDGDYPAPSGASVVYTCPHAAKFTDGSIRHHATCSALLQTSWKTSFNGKHVRCQKGIAYPECRLTKMGKEYIGTVNTTKTGKPCLRWNSPESTSFKTKRNGFDVNIIYEEHFLNQDPSSHGNFCRNPTSIAEPWCFVDDGSNWELCEIPFCLDLRPPDCKMTQKGAEYIGTKSKTISGSPCLPWIGLQSPISVEMFALRKLVFPDSLTKDHNFCRNPTGKPGGPWCKILGPTGSTDGWEYCDVRSCAVEETEEACEAEGRCQSAPSKNMRTSTGDGVEASRMYPECRMTPMGKEYRGTHSQTETGEKCLPWMDFFIEGSLPDVLVSHLPYHERLAVPNDMTEAIYDFIKNQDLNYCRNPSRAERPWCFIRNGSSWEYCDIPLCHSPKEPLECRLTDEGLEYAELKNADADGRMCQPWFSRSNNKRFSLLNLLALPDQSVDSSHNYCRNPNVDRGGPWCFTEEGTGEGWRQCGILFCFEEYERSALDDMASKPSREAVIHMFQQGHSPVKIIKELLLPRSTVDKAIARYKELGTTQDRPRSGRPRKRADGYPECLQTAMGKEYAGTTRTTESGKPCLRWDSRPYGTPEDFDPNIRYEDHFRFGNATLHQDFCRNPALKKQPWCFVADPAIKWEFCEIPPCPNRPNKMECKWTWKGEEYAGTENRAASGRSCLPWRKSELLGLHWPRFPEDVRSKDHNFCRNPTGDKNGTFCLVETGTLNLNEFETCDIPFCPFHYLY